MLTLAPLQMAIKMAVTDLDLNDYGASSLEVVIVSPFCTSFILKSLIGYILFHSSKVSCNIVRIVW